MKLSLILTQKSQLRVWLSKNTLTELLSCFELTIYAPISLKKTAEVYLNQEFTIHYFQVPSRPNLEMRIFSNLLVSHLHGPSFRRRFKYEIQGEGSLFGYLLNPKALLRSIVRNRFLIRCALSRKFRLLNFNLLTKEVLELQFCIDPCHLVVVVSNCSDLANEIAVQSAVQSAKPWVQIVDNWDNLSSKLCPSNESNGLIVWGRQTDRLAREIHLNDHRNIEALGSSRIPNVREIDKLKNLRRQSNFNTGTLCVFYAGYGGKNENLNFMEVIYREICKEFPQLEIKVRFRPHPLSVKVNTRDYYMDWPRYYEIDLPRIEHQDVEDWPKLDKSLYDEMLKSDLVIGAPSTFLLEAMIFNLPIVLDLRKSWPKFYSHRDRFETASHFREIVDSNLFPKVRKTSEIGKTVRSALANPSDYTKLVQFILHNDSTDFAERLTQFLTADFASQDS